MENLTGGTPPVRYLPCVVPCKLYFVFVKDRTPSINGDNFSADELYMEYISWAETGHNKIMTRSNFRQKIQPIIEEYYPTYERYRSSKCRLNWRDTRTK